MTCVLTFRRVYSRIARNPFKNTFLTVIVVVWETSEIFRTRTDKTALAPRHTTMVSALLITSRPRSPWLRVRSVCVFSYDLGQRCSCCATAVAPTWWLRRRNVVPSIRPCGPRFETNDSRTVTAVVVVVGAALPPKYGTAGRRIGRRRRVRPTAGHPTGRVYWRISKFI